MSLELINNHKKLVELVRHSHPQPKPHHPKTTPSTFFLLNSAEEEYTVCATSSGGSIYRTSDTSVHWNQVFVFLFPSLGLTCVTDVAAVSKLRKSNRFSTVKIWSQSAIKGVTMHPRESSDMVVTMFPRKQIENFFGIIIIIITPIIIIIRGEISRLLWWYESVIRIHPQMKV